MGSSGPGCAAQSRALVAVSQEQLQSYMPALSQNLLLPERS